MANQQQQQDEIIKTLLFALEKTLSPVLAERQNAEATLLQFEKVSGYVWVLFSISANGTFPIPIRQSASIYLKNLFRKSERQSNQQLVSELAAGQVPKDRIHISDNDKKLIKENILQALVAAPPLISKQLCETLKCLVESDFPDQWGDLLPQLHKMLTSQNSAETSSALLAIYCVVKNFELRDEESGQRLPLNHVVEMLFPVLLQLLTFVSSMNENTAETWNMQILVIKTFWAATQFGLPPMLMNPDVFLGWMNQFLAILSRPITDNLGPIPTDPDVMKEWPFWRAKKWVAHIFLRLFSRFGNSRFFDEETEVEYRKFADRFLEFYAVKLMETFLSLLSSYPPHSPKAPLPDKLSQLCFEYINTSIKFSKTFISLKPHLNAFLQQILFPALCFNARDLHLFNHDPHEYLRKEHDLMEEFNNPKKAAFNVIYDLVKHRSKAFFFQFMQFVVERLSKFHQLPPNEKNFSEKDGLMFVIGSLSRRLKKTPEFLPSLEGMVLTHVLPDFSSPVGLLRAKACWVFGQFADIEYKNSETFITGLKSVLVCMRDPEMVVRVEAGIAINNLVEIQLATDQLRPILPQLMEEIFKLMKEFENEDLVGSLKSIINIYHEEIVPYATVLTERLVTSFFEFVADKENDSSGIPASECLNTLQTLVLSVIRIPSLYANLEAILYPLLQKLTTSEHLDFMEDTSALLSIVTYHAPTFSPALWSLFPNIIQIVHENPDYIEDMLPPLDNFISRSTDVFLSDPQYIKMILSIYEKMVAPPPTKVRLYGEQDSGVACEIVEVVLQVCRGKVDQYLQPILALAVQRFFNPHHTRKVPFKILLLDVFANCLYYNPLLTISILDSMKTPQMDVIQSLFLAWFKLLFVMKRNHDRKISILGLSSLFHHFSSLPGLIQAGSKNIAETLIHVAFELYKERAKRDSKKKDSQEKKQEQKEGEEEEEEYEDVEEDEEEDEEVPDDQDVCEDVDELKLISKSVKRIFKEEEIAKTGDINTIIQSATSDEPIDHGDDDDDDDEFDDDFDDEDDEFEDLITPIDKLDELVFLVQSLKVFCDQHGPVYETMISSLSPEHQAKFQELIKYAEQTVQKQNK